jgi:predicted DsbA family dithiol-disulfide isomerase
MKIDFVSDIACPWCAVGLNSLEQALARIGAAVPVELHFQPFELNPQLGPEGEDAAGHLMRKYRISAEQLAQNRKVLVERGAAVGFSFGERSHIWNTFDAHRLLHWAGERGAEHQRKLKHALLAAYHTRGENPGARDVLLRLAGEVGLDVDAAREVLDAGRFADEVRSRQDHYRQLGISAVPSVIVDDRHLIQGGQPPEVFEQALRQIAAGG